ncbi:hypothetical protein BpHYR1_023002 [Brachionus plicatilis]|uniref:Uncharacterized protein n=1 Tax=Brachionus plicatilis TaxID=10195 RepID=A0A3M7QVX3_BRAPC|nr:hypothetical protein BpHYR1_023002 [Brachionus plicatilis]
MNVFALQHNKKMFGFCLKRIKSVMNHFASIKPKVGKSMTIIKDIFFFLKPKKSQISIDYVPLISKLYKTSYFLICSTSKIFSNSVAKSWLVGMET